MYIRVPIDHTLGESIGPFEGTFTGTVSGDNNTMATVAVTLNHRDNKIEGNITLGKGLQLNFKGPCGLEPVDLEKIPISGTTDPANPLHFQTSTQVKEPTQKQLLMFKVNFVVTNVTIDALLNQETQTINANITLEPVSTEPPRPLIGCTKRALKVELKRAG